MPGIYDFGIRPLNLSQDFEQGRERKRVDGLRALAGDYYGKQDPMLGQVARLDPAAAGAMQKDMQGQQDRQREQLGQFASMLVKAPPQMRPGLYRQMHAQLSQIIPDAPPEYSAEIDGLAEQIAQTYGGPQGQPEAWSNGGNGFMVSTRGQSKQIPGWEQQRQSRARPVMVPDGRGGSQMMLYDPDTQAVQPMSFGGPQPQFAPQPQEEGQQIDLASLPPAEQQAAKMAASGQDAYVQGGVAHAGSTLQGPQSASGSFPGMGYKPPPVRKPVAGPGAAKPPAGYRWAAGGALEAIPGGPADRNSPTSGARSVKDPTEDQSKAAAWHAQATNAYANLQKVYAADNSSASPGIIETYSPMDEIANRSRSASRQQYVQAAASLSEALLRAATGAGITIDEAQQKIREVTPQRGDSQPVIDQKMAAIPVYLESLKNRAGRALRPTIPAANFPTAADAEGRTGPIPSSSPKRMKFNPKTGKIE